MDFTVKLLLNEYLLSIPELIHHTLAPQLLTSLTATLLLLISTHANTLFGWRREDTKSMLLAVLKRQQQRALGSVTLITDYFTNEQPPLAQSSNEPDEVSMRFVDISILYFATR